MNDTPWYQKLADMVFPAAQPLRQAAGNASPTPPARLAQGQVPGTGASLAELAQQQAARAAALKALATPKARVSSKQKKSK